MSARVPASVKAAVAHLAHPAPAVARVDRKCDSCATTDEEQMVQRQAEPGATGHRFAQVPVSPPTVAAPSSGPELAVSQPGDASEREADQMAEEATRLLASGDAAGAPAPSFAGSGERLSRAVDDAAAAPAAGGFLVEDDAATLLPGQMRKGPFLAALREAACASANRELARAGRDTEGCPFLERWFDYYEKRDASQVERALRKYAPEAAQATSAADYIPIVSARAGEGARNWVTTGALPPMPEGMLDGGGILGAIGGAVGGALSAIGGLFFKADSGGARGGVDRGALGSRLGGGRPLDGSAQSRMGAAFGYDFSRVRVHDDRSAADAASALNAQAFTVGTHVAFAAGRYRPGNVMGDALLAHELAHVVQQGGAPVAGAPAPSSDAMEQDADGAAVNAVASLWEPAPGQQLPEAKDRRRMPRMRGGWRLQRCPDKPPPATAAKEAPKATAKAPDTAATGAPANVTCAADPDIAKAKADMVTTFGLAAVTETTACWTLAELGKMKTAFGKVPADQRSAYKGVTLVRVKVTSGKKSDPQGQFIPGVNTDKGVRDDVIEIADGAFDLEKTTVSGGVTTIGSPTASIGIALHEIGHAEEDEVVRAAQIKKFQADKATSTTVNTYAGLLKAASDSISNFTTPGASAPADIAYNNALLNASTRLDAALQAPPSTIDTLKPGEIRTSAASVAAKVSVAAAALAAVTKARKGLSATSTVAQPTVESAMATELAALQQIPAAMRAAADAVDALAAGKKEEAAASVSVTFTTGGTQVDLPNISRRLAELVAFVDIKKIDVKNLAGLGFHPKNNWPNNPAELFAELYSQSFMQPDLVKSYHAELPSFFTSPIGPKGAAKAQVATWISSHLAKP